MGWLWTRAPVEDPEDEYKYAITIDSGSSGSRLEIYSWLDHSIAEQRANATQRASLPVINIGRQKKVHPGISTYASNPSNVGEHLEPLLNYAIKHIPEKHHSSTPLFLLATAGMRLLTPNQQTAILSSACAYTRERTPFILPDCDAHFQVIDGVTEGLYGWISINYLLGSFDRPDLHNHGKVALTESGFIDMGGASAQVAFAPNQTETARHAEDLMFLRLRTLDGIEKEYRIFVSTWLGYGANEARRRYLQELEKLSKSADPILRDPCLPKGLELPTDNSKLSLLGTGSLEECLNLQTPLLAKDMDCHDDPCLFGGVHAPAIDFDVNHFIGVSEYWHTTNDVFDMGGTYDYATYSSKVEQFCSRKWEDIVLDLKRQKWGKKLDEEKVRMVCFKAAWMMNVLHDGFGVPRLTREFDTPPSSSHNSTQDLIDSAKSHGFLQPFQSVERIRGVEVSWTLGKMVLYASSTIDSINMSPTKEIDDVDVKYMVGFGPNNNHLYTNGEFYTPTGSVVDLPPDGPLSRLTEVMGHRVPGLLLFLTMICVAIWLVIGKDRRNRVLGATTRKWFKKRRKVMGASGIYERLEAGDVDDEFEEGEVGGRAWALQELKPQTMEVASVSGSASPRFDTGVMGVSSLGRSESRERLPSRPVSRSDLTRR